MNLHTYSKESLILVYLLLLLYHTLLIGSLPLFSPKSVVVTRHPTLLLPLYNTASFFNSILAYYYYFYEPLPPVPPMRLNLDKGKEKKGRGRKKSKGLLFFSDNPICKLSLSAARDQESFCSTFQTTPFPFPNYFILVNMSSGLAIKRFMCFLTNCCCYCQLFVIVSQACIRYVIYSSN